tara:strand:- start:2821 stop:4260 length:1440 start_codon:yes stop_codon:yes gene_type:complete
MLSYDWPTIQKRIFDTESGGDYNALYGYANRPGKAFAGTSVTDMTVDQALAFADPSGPYAQSVKSQVGRVATPMGAYQVVGSTLADAKRGLRLTGSEKMTPGLQDMIGKWVLNTQGPGAWEGLKNISKGASNMAATLQPPYMMGGDSTYNVVQREEPRAGLLGLFDRATTRDERTGLNPMQNFAAALDPLIMPELRGGDAIRKQGAQRAGELSRNRTVGMLRQQGQNKIADMLEQGLISGSDAGKYLLAAGGKKKPIVVGGKLIDPDTFEVLYGASAPTGGDFKDAQSFRKEFTSLSRIKGFAGVTEAYSRIVASAKDPSAAGDLSLIFNFMKVLDPGSTVREGEFATAQNAGGVDARVRSLFNSVVDGTRLDAGQRADFLDRANRLYKSQESLVLPLYDYYGNIAKSRGFDPEMVLPQFGYTGDMPEVAPEFAARPPPPMPEGATADGQPLTQPAWQAIWNARSTEEKKKFMETGAFE